MTRLAARVFRASHALERRLDRQARRALAVAKAVHSGAWLGALSAEALVELDEAAYDRGYAYHRTDAHNLRGLFPWEEAALDRHFPRSGRLLVTSAGGGREVIALRRRGFEVDASECNAALRAAANDLLARSGLAGDVLPAPRDGWVDTGRTYDGIVVGWGSYTFVRGRARRIALLRALGSMTSPGGPILLSFFARTDAQRSFAIAAAVGSGVARLLGREALDVGDVLDPAFQHYFTKDEVEGELAAAGFLPVAYATEGYAHAIALGG